VIGTPVNVSEMTVRRRAVILKLNFSKSYDHKKSFLLGHSVRNSNVHPVYFSLLLGGAMIYWHWEAMVISYLATRVIVLPFTSISELLDKSNFLIALQPGSSYEDAFKLSTDPIWQD
jgi:hypothetical protein